MRFLSLSLSLSLSLASRGGGPTAYYVSSVFGNDASSGTSSTSPWRTLGRAASATLLPGDSVLLRMGDSWSINTSWSFAGLNGTAAAPITFAAYADATSSPNRPLVARSADVPAAGPTLRFWQSSGLVIDGLEIFGGENAIAFLFDVPATVPHATFSNLYVADCLFRNITGLVPNATSGSWWGNAIAIAAAHAGVTVTNATIVNTVTIDSDTMYGNFVPWEPGNWTRALVSGLTMAGNTLERVSFNSVFLDTTDHVSLTRNVFRRNTPDQLFLYGTTDIILGTLDATNTFVDNEIFLRGEYPNGPDGCAIDLETSATGVLFSQNYIAHSTGAGIMVFGHQTTSQDISILNNTFIADGCVQTRGDKGGIGFLHEGSSGRVNGNVFTTCPGNSPPVFNTVNASWLDGWDLTGNVVDGQNGTVTVVENPAVAATVGASGITVTATCATTGAVLYYTVDGSKPSPATSPVFPASGSLLLPLRSVAVSVKAFPAQGGRVVVEGKGAAAAAAVVVESAAEGLVVLVPR
jgi:hypothetical protein